MLSFSFKNRIAFNYIVSGSILIAIVFLFIYNIVKYSVNKHVNEEIQEELFNQTFGPVKWVEIINKLAENGVTKIYEIGPGSILKGMIKKINGDIEVINVSKIDDLANL